MPKNNNHKYLEEQNNVQDMGELGEWVEAVRSDEPSEADWQNARSSLAARLQSESKENVFMNLIRNAFAFQCRQWTKAVGFAVVVLVVMAGAGLWDRSAGLAFADVIEHIRSVQSLIFTSSVEGPNQPKMTFQAQYLEPGRQRTISPEGNILVMDMEQGKSMSLIPSAKKGSILDFSQLPQKQQSQTNFVDYLRKLQSGAEMILGHKEFDGVTAKGFYVEQDGQKYTIWADLKTGLPVWVKIEMAMYGDMSVILTDFQFNPDLDESLFEIALPTDYEEIKMPVVDVSEPTEQDLIDLLRMIAEKNQGEFPSALTMQDVAKLLGGKIGDGEPSQQDIQDFSAQFVKLTRGLLFFQKNSNNDWHYQTDGVKLGDSDPICWWKPADSATYRVIYADLTAADVHSNDF
ncbi:MAG: hypothetical protein JXR73_04520 [Candidatus Omnitrophica bacterium]|nr:hypothetical protein [Candidatus Omnitrophota bacterium]